MKSARLLLCSAAALAFVCPAQAQNYSSLQVEIDELREDVKILQRQAYRDKESGLAPGSTQNVMVQLGALDENVRRINGRIDELDYKIKQLNERLDLINKDVDVRIKMIEGKPVGGGKAVSDAQPAQKFKAPVAQNAPKSIVGDSIKTGDDLPAVKTKSADEIYKEGQEALKANENELAAQKFTAILTKYPDHKLAGNAQYWLGEAYYAQKDYAKAAVAFGKGLEKYKNVKGADNLLKLGMSMKELGKKDEACTAFTTLPKEFPKAEQPVKDKAKKFANDLKCDVK